MKYYYVFVRENVSNAIWTVPVCVKYDAPLLEVMETASKIFENANAFGLQELGTVAPEGFEVGVIEVGMKGK